MTASKTEVHDYCGCTHTEQMPCFNRIAEAIVSPNTCNLSALSDVDKHYMGEHSLSSLDITPIVQEALQEAFTDPYSDSLYSP